MMKINRNCFWAKVSGLQGPRSHATRSFFRKTSPTAQSLFMPETLYNHYHQMALKNQGEPPGYLSGYLVPFAFSGQGKAQSALC